METGHIYLKIYPVKFPDTVNIEFNCLFLYKSFPNIFSTLTKCTSIKKKKSCVTLKHENTNKTKFNKRDEEERVKGECMAVDIARKQRSKTKIM